MIEASRRDVSVLSKRLKKWWGWGFGSCPCVFKISGCPKRGAGIFLPGVLGVSPNSIFPQVIMGKVKKDRGILGYVMPKLPGPSVSVDIVEYINLLYKDIGIC